MCSEDKTYLLPTCISLAAERERNIIIPRSGQDLYFEAARQTRDHGGFQFYPILLRRQPLLGLWAKHVSYFKACYGLRVSDDGSAGSLFGDRVGG